MNFRVGQKVVCVDAKNRGGGCRLREGVIYTIRGFNDGYDNGDIGVLLEEVQGGTRPSGKERGFYKDRFRPVVERKTDISIFTRMLTPKKQNAHT